MKEIIERPKIKAFVKKLELEWSSSIDHWIFQNENLIYLHLNPGIDPSEFMDSLMPKAGMFVDFETRLELILLDSNGEKQELITFNLK